MLLRVCPSTLFQPHVLSSPTESKAATWPLMAITFRSSSISLGTSKMVKSHRNPMLTEAMMQRLMEHRMASGMGSGSYSKKPTCTAGASPSRPPLELPLVPRKPPHIPSFLTVMVDRFPTSAFLSELGTWWGTALLPHLGCLLSLGFFGDPSEKFSFSK